MRREVAIADRPATPTPITSTVPGLIEPVAKVVIGIMRAMLVAPISAP